MNIKKFLILLIILSTVWTGMGEPAAGQSSGPRPLLEKGEPVDWWFVFKFNAATFPGCGDNGERSCLFGGTVQDYKSQFSQQFVYASSNNPHIQKGTGCLGSTLKDPVGSHVRSGI